MQLHCSVSLTTSLDVKDLTLVVFFWTEYLDGMTSKDDIYNKVYESVQNSLLNNL